MDQYMEISASVIGVQQVPDNETNRYGIISPLEKEGRRYIADSFIEKPTMGTAHFNLDIMGRYIFKPEIFSFLEKQEAGAGGEIQLSDAIQQLNLIQRVFAYDFEDKRYDVGKKLGFVNTTIGFALQDEELKSELLEFLEGILEMKVIS